MRVFVNSIHQLPTASPKLVTMAPCSSASISKIFSILKHQILGNTMQKSELIMKIGLVKRFKIFIVPNYLLYYFESKPKLNFRLNPNKSNLGIHRRCNFDETESDIRWPQRFRCVLRSKENRWRRGYCSRNWVWTMFRRKRFKYF